MTSLAPADSLFDCFIACRAPGDVPSDFDLMMLDAILAMSGVAQQQADLPGSTTSLTTVAPLTLGMSHSFGVTRCPDRLFPISLLKCPLGVFLSFCKRHHLQSTLAKALHDARRRKTNRKFQRVTRNRRRGKSEIAEVESDDECCGLPGQFKMSRRIKPIRLLAVFFTTTCSLQ